MKIFQNQERQLYESISNDFEEKLRKVEEERHTSEMYSGNTIGKAFGCPFVILVLKLEYG